MEAPFEQHRIWHQSLTSAWLSIWRDRRAITALEYALIVGIIVATGVIGFMSLCGAGL